MPSTPEQTVLGDIYQFAWAQEGVSILLDRLQEDTKQVVTAEMTIQQSVTDRPSHLHQARVNLTSTTARTTVAKHVATRADAPDVDWVGIIEQACTLTLRAFRQGEPVHQVGNMPPREAPRFRLEPLFYEGQPNLIYGPGGIGKSFLGVLFALMVQTGAEITGFTPRIGNVLYLDYETSKEEIDERVQLLKAGLNMPREAEFSYRYCNQALAAEMAEIRRLVAQMEIEFVVVDSVGSACGGDPESADSVLRYFNALRSLRVTTLSIDHVSKADADKPFGSVYKWNQARVAYQVRGQQEPGDDHLEVGLFQRKNNSGRLLKPIGLSFSFANPLRTEVKRVDVLTVPDLAKGASARDQISSE